MKLLPMFQDRNNTKSLEAFLLSYSLNGWKIDETEGYISIHIPVGKALHVADISTLQGFKEMDGDFYIANGYVSFRKAAGK